LSADFSSDGLHLAIGSASETVLIRLGCFLGTDLVPLTWKVGVEGLPAWARNEVLYRSGYGPSFVQRLMGKGRGDRQLATSCFNSSRAPRRCVCIRPTNRRRMLQHSKAVEETKSTQTSSNDACRWVS
jgi:hypothetical protein